MLGFGSGPHKRRKETEDLDRVRRNKAGKVVKCLIGGEGGLSTPLVIHGAFCNGEVSARGVKTSASPMRRSSSARTRSNTMFTTSPPSCVGSTCTRNGLFPNGVSTTLRTSVPFATSRQDV